MTYDQIAAHLETCRPCLEEYDLDRVIKQILARSCQCERTPVEVRVKVLARIRSVQVQTPDSAGPTPPRLWEGAQLLGSESGVGALAVVSVVALAVLSLAGALSHGFPLPSGRFGWLGRAGRLRRLPVSHGAAALPWVPRAGPVLERGGERRAGAGLRRDGRQCLLCRDRARSPCGTGHDAPGARVDEDGDSRTE